MLELKIRAVLTIGLFLATASAFGQAASSWPCADDLIKSESDNRRVRVSTGVALAFAEKQSFPDVSDLKDSKIKSDVVVKLLIGKDGVVRCADAVEGANDLWARSVEAAKRWQFKPYLLNGEAVMVETRIEFAFKKSKVSVRQAAR